MRGGMVHLGNRRFSGANDSNSRMFEHGRRAITFACAYLSKSPRPASTETDSINSRCNMFVVPAKAGNQGCTGDMLEKVCASLGPRFREDNNPSSLMKCALMNECKDMTNLPTPKSKRSAVSGPFAFQRMFNSCGAVAYL